MADNKTKDKGHSCLVFVKDGGSYFYKQSFYDTLKVY